MKLSFNEIKQKVSNLTNGEYIIMEERLIKTDKSQRREFKILHTVCNKTFWLQLSRITGKNFQACPYCNTKKSKINEEIFKEKIFNLVGNEYTVIGNYKNNYTKIALKHNICGNILEMEPKHFLNDNHRCKICALKNKYNKHFTEDLNIMSNNTISLEENYHGAHAPHTFMCKKCNKKFTTTPAYLYSQNRKFGECYCPLCLNTSIGEKLIINILSKYNIQYDYNKHIEGCINKHPLRFDFIIKNENNVVCIEFDGKQHYSNKSIYYMLDNEIQKRDEIKNNFCKDNNIPLLRISSYSKLKIEKELLSFLKENKIISSTTIENVANEKHISE